MEEAHRESKSSRLLKAKKYVVSRMTETRSGRTFLMKNFGEAGVQIMECLKSTATRFRDARTAKELKRDVLKVVTKAVLLHSNKVITEEMALPSREPTLACIQRVQEALDASIRGHEVDVQDVAKRITEAHDALLAILKPHVREHNWRRLTRAMRFYGDPEFLGAMTTNPEYAADRARLKVAVAELTRPFENELLATTQFLAERLKRRAATLDALIEAPELRGFLADDLGAEALSRWLAENDPTDYRCLEFVRAVEYFKTTANLGLRGPRANQIRVKYFGSDAASFDPDAVRACEASIAKTPPPRDTFRVLEAQAIDRLRVAFERRFVASPAFRGLKKERDDLATRVAAMEHQIRSSDAGAVEHKDDDDDDDDEDDDSHAS
ncbi:hypothetical protein CTAYLR_000085 [Chrysophaeum taylorii]|uniref:RGS domain-containing protein n=1 Tax=Chrysophaeum taylorii TaxID=2483200 RepID=A0AAD7UI65_9STRA|nr:hypothetical protein CTAYLR_000085 [Chrysophaeum taylorii]